MDSTETGLENDPDWQYLQLEPETIELIRQAFEGKVCAICGAPATNMKRGGNFMCRYHRQLRETVKEKPISLRMERASVIYDNDILSAMGEDCHVI